MRRKRASVVAGSYFGWFGDNIPATVRNGTALYDVLIIGSGGAGMRAALEATKQKGLKVRCYDQNGSHSVCNLYGPGRY